MKGLMQFQIFTASFLCIFQKVIGRFLERLASLTVHFELCSTNVRELTLQMPKDHFARIEVGQQQNLRL